MEQVTQMEQTLESEVQEVKEVKPEVSALEQKLKDQDALIKKLRVYEKQNKTEAEQKQKEAGEYKELYEQVNTKYQNKVINGSLRSALEEAGAFDIDTVMKLADKTQITIDADDEVDQTSLKQLIASLKKAHSKQFEKREHSSIKQVAQPKQAIDFNTTARQAKTVAELQALQNTL